MNSKFKAKFLSCLAVVSMFAAAVPCTNVNAANHKGVVATYMDKQKKILTDFVKANPYDSRAISDRLEYSYFADVNDIVDEKGCTLLAIAVQNYNPIILGSYDVIKMLLDEGSDPDREFTDKFDRKMSIREFAVDMRTKGLVYHDDAMATVGMTLLRMFEKAKPYRAKKGIRIF